MSWKIGAGWRSWLSAVLAAGCGLGCQALMGKTGIPEDPLFVSRKPIESKAITAAPIAVAFVEPPQPQGPQTALASGKDRPSAPDKKSPSASKVPGILTSQPGSIKDGPQLPAVKPR